MVRWRRDRVALLPLVSRILRLVSSLRLTRMDRKPLSETDEEGTSSCLRDLPCALTGERTEAAEREGRKEREKKTRREAEGSSEALLKAESAVRDRSLGDSRHALDAEATAARGTTTIGITMVAPRFTFSPLQHEFRNAASPSHRRPRAFYSIDSLHPPTLLHPPHRTRAFNRPNPRTRQPRRQRQSLLTSSWTASQQETRRTVRMRHSSGVVVRMMLE